MIPNFGPKKLDQVQHRALRFFCGVPRTCPLAGIYGDTGWTPGVVRRDLECLRLYNQFIRMSDGCLTRQIFELESANEYQNSWFSNLKSICNSTNMVNRLENRLTIPIKEAKSKLLEWYCTALKTEIECKPKLSLFNRIKIGNRTEKYVKFNLTKAKHALICHIRNGILLLAIETGRYINTPRELRICQLCTKDVETELHFMFECEKLLCIRQELYNSCPELLNHSDLIKRFEFLCTKPYVIGKYIEKMWQERNRLIEQIGKFVKY